MKTGRAEEIFSVWLMSKGEIADQLRALIVRLSLENSTPTFEPHVTLIGELNLPATMAVAMTKEMAPQIEPFDIRLNEVEHDDCYFRCVFIKADKTPELIKANSVARAVFRQNENEKYMPHLSLVYGDLDSQMRQKVIRSTGNKMKIVFPVREICLYYTGGKPAGWYCLSRIPCGRSNV